MPTPQTKRKPKLTKGARKRTYQSAKKTDFKRKLKSKFELKVHEALTNLPITFTYEEHVLEYTQTRKYCPDFVIKAKDPNDLREIIVEAKGLFDSEDRRKHLDVKKQHPNRDIRFLFYTDQKLRRGAKSTYSEWATKHGFKYAIKTIPVEWFEELGYTKEDIK